MKSANPYAYLKTPCLEPVELILPSSSWKVSISRDETITIFTAPAVCGSWWAYGYLVQWQNGRVSAHTVSSELGLFRSEREAKLYAIGFMLIYAEYFTEENRTSLRFAENSLIQATLF